jgi:hypothetical protein
MFIVDIDYTEADNKLGVPVVPTNVAVPQIEDSLKPVVDQTTPSFTLVDVSAEQSIVAS